MPVCSRCGRDRPVDYFAVRKGVRLSYCTPKLCSQPEVSPEDLGTKFIPGITNNEYSISSDGRVYNHRRNRWLKNTTNASGYATVGLRMYGTCLVHHLILETYVGPKPKGLIGLHIDDNKDNNKLTNLVWGTYSTNTTQSYMNGKHKHSRFTPDDIRDIRARHERGETNYGISTIYNCYPFQISQIVRRKTWNWVG